MTDRELLELAAKAIHMDVAFFGDDVEFDCLNDEQQYWNPLIDLSDRYSLAKKLGMQIDFCAYTIRAPILDKEGCFLRYVENQWKSDADEGLAILKVAAEIGRAVE